MTSFYEIGGLILSGAEAENEYAYARGNRSALGHKQRKQLLEDMKMVQKELPKTELASSGKSSGGRPSFAKHYWESFKFYATEPTRQIFKDPSLLIPSRKTKYPLFVLVPWYTDKIIVPGLEKQYEYFVEGEDPWDR
jgi:hypothetical protein